MFTAVAIYGSHNASVALSIDGEIKRVIEIERLVGMKNMGLFFYLSTNYAVEVMEEIQKLLYKEFRIEEYDLCIHQYTNGNEKIFPSKEYVEGWHHESHAANSFYQSNHNEALIFSFDGGGQDRDAYVFFRAYYAKREQELEVLETIPFDLGFPYMTFGHYLEDIRKEPLFWGNLVYSGKVMGLCGYGNVREEWLDHFADFYVSNPDGPEGVGSYIPKMKELGDKCGIDLSENVRHGGQLGQDIAATSQAAFEKVVLHLMKPHLDKYPHIPVHMAGGCGLNILLNTKIKEELNRQVFVAPNPNDCGLAVGMLCAALKPEKQVDITYAGPEVFDREFLMDYVHNKGGVKIEPQDVVDKLKQGRIVGVVRGNCEHGPRALGNRSILCYPSNGMKDTLNAKVKNREYYRPFAPVVRYEDASKYFEFHGESRWMGFCPRVREQYREELESITHVDGTARIQTIKYEQNPYLYSILTLMENAGMIPVLLNTSFNVAGKPILNSYKDAFRVLGTTELDGILLENYYFQ